MGSGCPPFICKEIALWAAETLLAVRKSLTKHESTQPFTGNIDILQDWALRCQGGFELCWHFFLFASFLPFKKMGVEN